MDNLDTSAIEAESANLPADAIGMSRVIRRAEAMHEEPWEYVYEYAQRLNEADNLDTLSLEAEYAHKYMQRLNKHNHTEE